MNTKHAEPFTDTNNKQRLRNTLRVVQRRHSQETPARAAGGSKPLKQGCHCSTVHTSGVGVGVRIKRNSTIYPTMGRETLLGQMGGGRETPLYARVWDSKHGQDSGSEAIA